ncbi:MAG: hypothetical protein AABY18_07520 [Candidatus Thermoplasmatota archaeon]
MHPRTAALLAALAFLPLAGCVADESGPDLPGPGDPGYVPVMEAFVNPIDLNHDHGDIALHNASNNVDLVGHVDFGIEPTVTLGELDFAGDYVYVAVFGHGFAIVDVADPANPVLVSITEVPALGNPPVVGPQEAPVVGQVRNVVSDRYMADLKVDQTGDWVFVAPELSETPGVLIYDARDRANPVLAGFWPQPGLLLGCHMIEYAVINEQEYVFCAPLDNAVYVGLLAPAAGPQRQIVTVARWVPNSPGYVQNEVDGLTTDPVATAGRYVLSGHQDMTYQPDPITGAPTLFVSFWNLGLRIVDVSIPAVPLEIGFWEGVGADGYRGNLHTAMAFAVNGTRVAIAIPEGPDPPAMFVLDATDIANPVVLSEWTALPSFRDSENASQAGSFSLHNFQIVDGKVYICMGHGGIWVIDVSTPEKLRAPEAVGSYYPHQPRRDNETYSIYPWDVVVKDGYMFDAEGNTGLYVLHFRDDPAGDETYDSFA